MSAVIPEKLHTETKATVVALARSLKLISKDVKEIADKRLKDLGIKVNFSSHADEMDEFISSSIELRINDLHEAFLDKETNLILSVIGGFNSNQLLPHIDYEIIKNNPKILCGYSDITAVLNAIYAKTGIVTYYGPHYSSFGEKQGFDYTLSYFKKCLFQKEVYILEPSDLWSNDKWYRDQEKRVFLKNEGYWLINEGEGEGVSLGGNLCTFNLLQGTMYMPEIAGSILFFEDDSLSTPEIFDRDLQSLLHQKGADQLQGLILGRFTSESNINKAKLTSIILSKKELRNVPVIANVDFGHTEPRVTLPIGGKIKMSAYLGKIEISVTEH